jgi:hypothetical protein
METCWRCNQKLPQKVKFCPSCGATIAAKAPVPAPPPPVIREALDPLAATAPASAEQLAALRRGEVAPPSKAPVPGERYRGGTKPMKSQPQQPQPHQQQKGRQAREIPQITPSQVNPRGVGPTVNDDPAAASSGAAKAPSKPQPELPTLRSVDSTVTPSVISPRAVSHLAPPSPQPQPQPPSLQVGSRVLVEWSDGRRYPATIQQMASGQCLVLFPDGQHRWVDIRHVSPAMP